MSKRSPFPKFDPSTLQAPEVLDEHLHIRYSKRERNAFREAAKDIGMTTSEWLRALGRQASGLDAPARAKRGPRAQARTNETPEG